MPAFAASHEASIHETQLNHDADGEHDADGKQPLSGPCGKMDLVHDVLLQYGLISTLAVGCAARRFATNPMPDNLLRNT
jgi:hypothetical protein